MNIKKCITIMGILSISLCFTSEAKAYERFTWSELVTGSSSNQQANEKLNIITDWWGKKRVIHSNETVASLLKKSRNIIADKKNYSEDEIFKAVMNVRYIYKYHIKDNKKADDILNELDYSNDLKAKKKAEVLFSSFKPNDVLKDSFYEKLYNCCKNTRLYPYDNGYMPILKQKDIQYLLSAKEMIDGKGSSFQNLNQKSWKELPSEILYCIATDKRENAYKLYVSLKSDLEPQNIKLIEDFLYPLYMPVKKNDRKFLAGLFVVENFPSLGIDLINEALTDENRVTKPEHALACLSDVYIRHNAYSEAQKVLKILSDYYPDSLWLK